MQLKELEKLLESKRKCDGCGEEYECSSVWAVKRKNVQKAEVKFWCETCGRESFLDMGNEEPIKKSKNGKVKHYELVYRELISLPEWPEYMV